MVPPPSLDFETASPPPDKAIARVFPSGSNTGVLPQTEIIAKSPPHEKTTYEILAYLIQAHTVAAVTILSTNV